MAPKKGQPSVAHQPAARPPQHLLDAQAARMTAAVAVMSLMVA
jgi:hypothetical protein